ncbi:MAG: universal stress protein [Desulfobulbaceae bacterium]|nr:universal stress protein [Desulfobulbaceae bacterium]
MFKHILVPLDGSTLAETALVVAVYLAGLTKGRLTLMHVVEKDAPEDVHGEHHLQEAAEAGAYLERVRERFIGAGGEWKIHVHGPAAANVADGIVAHEQELEPDLIVMCTHGPGRLERLLRGSLAQQVVALGHTPLLLVRPGAANLEGFALRGILLPLDGTSRHEGGLAVALELAGACQARLNLLAVVPSADLLAGPEASLARFLPGATRAMQELAAVNLREYLEGVRGRAVAGGIAASCAIRHGDVAGEIVQAAAANGAELIVLGTHGKAGTKAFWANSVAARVQDRTDRTLLLVPA